MGVVLGVFVGACRAGGVGDGFDQAASRTRMTATGMSRLWIYLRLRDLADEGHVILVSRGRWRAVTDDTE